MRIGDPDDLATQYRPTRELHGALKELLEAGMEGKVDAFSRCVRG